MKTPCGPRGGFSPEITRIADGFDGPLAVAIAGGDLAHGNEPIGRILIPVNGTDVSRRAAEVAFALARSGGSRVSALYVASGRSDGERRGRIRRGAALRRNEEAVLKDIAELADRYDLRIGPRSASMSPPKMRSSRPPSAAVTT